MAEKKNYSQFAATFKVFDHFQTPFSSQHKLKKNNVSPAPHDI